MNESAERAAPSYAIVGALAKDYPYGGVPGSRALPCFGCQRKVHISPLSQRRLADEPGGVPLCPRCVPADHRGLVGLPGSPEDVATELAATWARRRGGRN